MAVGCWVLVGLEVLGGVLLLVGEGGGCSWLSGTWSPTYWTSVLLNEEGLLGPLGETEREHLI